MRQYKKIRGTREIISGIHNYCDRWCERCAFTARCTVFAMGEEEDRIHNETDEPEKNLAEYVGSMLHDAMDLLHDLAVEHGIDFNSLDLEEPGTRKPVREHYLVRKADEHSKWLTGWFDNYQDTILNTLDFLKETSEKDHSELIEAIEVLRWYMHFIAVKFSRAVLMPVDNSLQSRSDKNGSAKIAIIAVDRSLEALAVMLRLFKSDEDYLLQGLVRLERIRKRALKDFPDAMSFKRPGFDDNKVSG